MLVSSDVVDNLVQIRNQVIRYLSYREHAVDELRLKLLKKFDSEQEVEQVLVHLRNEDLVSDQRYAESYVRSRVNKGYGPERIRNELMYKGVNKCVIETAFAFNKITWDQEVRKVWLKKFKNSSANNDLQNNAQDKERAKQWRFLQYRGFTHEQIKLFFECYLSRDMVF